MSFTVIGRTRVIKPTAPGASYRLPDGSRRKRSGFRNRTEARRSHADNVLPVVHRRRPHAPSDLTLRELVDRYLDRHARIRSPRTITTLREHLARPLAEYGDVRLVELEGMSDDVAEWRTTLPPRYAQGDGRTSSGTCRWRSLAPPSHQPAADAGENPEPLPRRIRAYTGVELDAIAEELVSADRPLAAYGPLTVFAAATGLRPEEWAALERRHVDRARRIVRVEQVLDGPGRIRPGGKTANSVREVPLTRRALAALEELTLRIDTTLLSPSPERKPLSLDNFRKREWAPAVEAAGVARPARMYDLRSMFASNALAAGVTVFELARVMGTSVRMIEKHYGALLDGAHTGTTARLDALEAAVEENDETGQMRP